MYEYITVKATNEKRLEYEVNEASEQGWEVVGYAIGPSGGFFFLFFGILTADHFAMLRRERTASP